MARSILKISSPTWMDVFFSCSRLHVHERGGHVHCNGCEAVHEKKKRRAGNFVPNIWCSCILFHRTFEQSPRRLLFLQKSEPRIEMNNLLVEKEGSKRKKKSSENACKIKGEMKKIATYNY